MVNISIILDLDIKHWTNGVVVVVACKIPIDGK